MENSKILAMNPAAVDDEDCFIRLCNGPQQEMRRRKRMAEEHRNRLMGRLLRDAVVVAGTIIALAVIASLL